MSGNPKAPVTAEGGGFSTQVKPDREIAGRARVRNPFASTRITGALALAAAGIVAGILLASIVVLLLVVLPANDTHVRKLAETRAGLAAAQADAIAEQLVATSRRLAESPATLSALQRSEPDVLKALEAQYEEAVAGALRVRIHRSGDAEIALNEVPPLTFAGLDLIRSAENGEPAGPEFLQTATGPMLNVVAGIPGDTGRPAGTVMVTFTAAILIAPFETLARTGGRYVLQQTFGSNPAVEITSAGSGASGMAVTHALAVRNWSVVHEPATAPPIASPLLTLPAWLLAILLGAGLTFYGHHRLRAGIQGDLERLVESAGALALGRQLTSPRDFTLDEFASAGATLVDLSEQIEVGAGEANAPLASQAHRQGTGARDGAVENTDLPPVIEDDLDESPVEAFLDIDDAPAVTAGNGLDDAELPPEVVFRDYDIRGIVGNQLNEVHAELIGRAVGSLAAEAGETTLAVAGDCRTSTPVLKSALIEGATNSGIDVIDLGDVPTPILYHTTHTTSVRSGVMVTGSHNAANYNGFKIVISGESLAGGRIAAIRERIRERRFTDGQGRVTTEDGVSRYIAEITSDIALAQPLKVVIDCGNGIAGVVGPRLLEALGCEVLPLYCEPDGSFPNHHPDPADPANLEDLSTVVHTEGADLGLALDGDGDRIAAVDEKGEVIWPDRLMMLFSRDIVGRNPGADIIFDVKCSRHLNSLIAEHGGRPIMWKTGHAHLKAKMRETGALLGGELSGHISFSERWHGFDDGLYSAARLLEIIAGEALATSEVFCNFPTTTATPEIRIDVDDVHKFDIVRRLISAGALDQGDVTTIDGLRVDYPDGWGLIRASNTAPALTLRFEADTPGAVREIVDQFRRALRDIDPSLDFTAAV